MPHGVQEHQQENTAEQHQALQDGAGGNTESQRDLCSKDAGNHKIKQFVHGMIPRKRPKAMVMRKVKTVSRKITRQICFFFHA